MPVSLKSKLEPFKFNNNDVVQESWKNKRINQAKEEDKYNNEKNLDKKTNREGEYAFQ